MRRYETMLIAHVDLSEDEVNKLITRYEGIITGQKGILVKIERWGKRKLAYLIKKQARGFYLLIDYAGVSAVVNELERNLKIDDKILKFMTVLKAEAVDPADIEKEIAEAAKKGKEEAPVAATKEPSAGKDEPLPPVPKETEADAKGEKES